MAGKATLMNELVLTGVGSEADLTLSSVESIAGQSTDTDEIDTSVLGDKFKQYVAGQKDAGDFDVTVNNNFDGQITTLMSLESSGETREWTINHKAMDGTSLATTTLSAWIKSHSFSDSTTDGKEQVTFTLRVTGEPVYAEV